MLGGWVTLPEGPVRIAAKSGAALLPVFTVGSERVPIVRIGPALPVNGPGAGDTRACIEATLQWLQDRIAQHPRDWIGWRAGLYRRGSRPAAAPGDAEYAPA